MSDYITIAKKGNCTKSVCINILSIFYNSKSVGKYFQNSHASKTFKYTKNINANTFGAIAFFGNSDII